MEVNIEKREIKERKAAWLNPGHPNFERWERARDLSIERGKFVKSIVEKYIICKSLSVLDLGSGEGGTSIVLSELNMVSGCDLSLIRLKRQKNNSLNYFRINCDALKLSFKENTFDLIIMQDVVEHMPDVNLLVNEIYRVLKPGGFIYVSTPNKCSIINLIADPHWGFPFVSILRRKTIKKYFLKYFRKDEINRQDIPQLLSLNDIRKYFGDYFEINLELKHSVEQLLIGNRGIIWSDFHLTLIMLVNKLKMGKLLRLFSNNKIGIINKFFSPAFYLVAKKILY